MTMTKAEARHAVVLRFGGEQTHIGPPGFGRLATCKFRSTAQADECHAVLNALEPGCTGGVFGFARLCIEANELDPPTSEGDPCPT